MRWGIFVVVVYKIENVINDVFTPRWICDFVILCSLESKNQQQQSYLFSVQRRREQTDETFCCCRSVYGLWLVGFLWFSPKQKGGMTTNQQKTKNISPWNKRTLQKKSNQWIFKRFQPRITSFSFFILEKPWKFTSISRMVLFISLKSVVRKAFAWKWIYRTKTSADDEFCMYKRMNCRRYVVSNAYKTN